MRGYCEVLLNVHDCQRPPGFDEGPRIRTKCYRCGGVACKRCSHLVGRIRMCNDCATDSGADT